MRKLSANFMDDLKYGNLKNFLTIVKDGNILMVDIEVFTNEN